jgi:peptidoglycan/LPS O-acetylase OafA/YrhL
MIQRIQSVWLLLAAACAFLTYNMVLYVGTLSNGTQLKFALADHFLLVAFIVGLGTLSLVAIMLFKNRKAQYRLTMTTLLLTVGFIFLEYYVIEDFKKDNFLQTGSYQIAALLPILMVIFLIFAARGIRRDEKLVKSLDRLR